MTDSTEISTDAKAKLAAVTLDELSIARLDSKIDHEREVAIYDLLEGNHFSVVGHEASGPYRLHLSIEEDKLIMALKADDETELTTHDVSLLPFRRLLRDYFLVLESYYKAVAEAQPAKIEAIDMGRRGLHDEGSRLLVERLAGDITLDFDTARRLFTLLAALHWKG